MRKYIIMLKIACIVLLVLSIFTEYCNASSNTINYVDKHKKIMINNVAYDTPKEAYDNNKTIQNFSNIPDYSKNLQKYNSNTSKQKSSNNEFVDNAIKSTKSTTKEMTQSSSGKSVYSGNNNVTLDTAGSVVSNVTGPVILALRVSGVSIAVIVLIWLAIKYMTSAPSGKAEVVKTAIPFIAGALILFSAGTILKTIAGLI